MTGGTSGMTLVLQGVLSALSFRVVSLVEGAASEYRGCKYPNSSRSSLEKLYTETMGNLDHKAKSMCDNNHVPVQKDLFFR